MMTFRSRRLAILLVFGLLVVIGAEIARAGDGSQLSLDRKSVLTNKNLGSERWAINYRLADGFVSASVYHVDGRDPSFVGCDLLQNDGVVGRFDCKGASACAVGPCPVTQYSALGIVELPLAFFFPPGVPFSPEPEGGGVIGRIGDWILLRQQTTDGRGGLWATSSNDRGDEMFVACIQFKVYFGVGIAANDVVHRNFDAYFTWDPDTAEAVTSKIEVYWYRGGSGFEIDNRFIERLYDRNSVRIKYEGEPSNQITEFGIREAQRAIAPVLEECGS